MNIRQFLHQAQNMLRATGIHPLLLVAGAAVCLVFPRFFFLAIVAAVIFWVSKNTRP